MPRSNVKMLPLRHWLLLGCLALTLVAGLSLHGTATARNQLRQESPLSPLTGESAPPASVDAPAAAPGDAAAERDIAPIPAQAPAAFSLPLGEPLRAQTSLVLVGLVLAGLVGAVVLIVVRQRRT